MVSLQPLPVNIMNKTEAIRQIGACATFFPLTEPEFLRFETYQKRDLQSLHNLPVPIQMIATLAQLIDELVNTGSEDDCLIDFVITPSLENVKKITSQFDVQYSRMQAIPIVLRHRFQQQDWKQIAATPKTLISFVETVMEPLVNLELLDWTNLSDSEHISTHELLTIYPSFNAFAKVALNVYADNVGFDVIADTQHHADTQTFLNDVLNR